MSEPAIVNDPTIEKRGLSVAGDFLAEHSNILANLCNRPVSSSARENLIYTNSLASDDLLYRTLRSNISIPLSELISPSSYKSARWASLLLNMQERIKVRLLEQKQHIAYDYN